MSSYRSHTCNELTKKHVGEKVTLSGWINRRRDHGDIIFIDLRDRDGVTQVVFDPSIHKDSHKLAEKVRPEYVIRIEGKVRERPQDMINKNLPTGEIEVIANEITVLNKAKTPPFEIADENDVKEELRLQYRYLDLRRGRMQRNIKVRHNTIQAIRSFFDKEAST